MQTFLPNSNFRASLECLDSKRLGKQRVEAGQILDILEGRAKTRAWARHPAVLMWKGYEGWLRRYYNTALLVWEMRGYKNYRLKPRPEGKLGPKPWWLGKRRLHSSHRAALLAKKLKHYCKNGWKETPAIKVDDSFPYWWPSKNSTPKKRGNCLKIRKPNPRRRKMLE
jgi:hypothetical protein